MLVKLGCGSNRDYMYMYVKDNVGMLFMGLCFRKRGTALWRMYLFCVLLP